MMYNEGHNARMLLKFVLTVIPAIIVLYLIDVIAKINYNSSLTQIIEDFLKSIGIV